MTVVEQLAKTDAALAKVNATRKRLLLQQRALRAEAERDALYVKAKALQEQNAAQAAEIEQLKHAAAKAASRTPKKPALINGKPPRLGPAADPDITTPADRATYASVAELVTVRDGPPDIDQQPDDKKEAAHG